MNASDTESMGGSSTLRQKLGEDNRLWLIAAGIIVIVTFWLIMHATSGGAGTTRQSLPSVRGSYDDQAHQQFTQQFMSRKNLSGSVIECGFAGPGLFRIAMPSSVSADEIDYTAKMAAQRIERRLRERSVITTYIKKPITGERVSTAKTRWYPSKNSYFTTFTNNPSKP